MSHLAVTIYGVVAVSFMMVMYTLERRHPLYILGFAAGCALSSSYGFLAGAWPFGVVEAIWSLIALRRYVDTARQPRGRGSPTTVNGPPTTVNGPPTA
ncbi:MAG TPA: hypothetical protein VG253_02600 [Streptosporangiaceae bacterium]|jgi:dolichyl-phosphate-mannose--protein O-mannosyl transferase|nr:hypothetical protein [Streptosporangiaceae bacterium]